LGSGFITLCKVVFCESHHIYMLILVIFRFSLKSLTFIFSLSCCQSGVNPFTKQPVLPCQGVIASARVVCGADQLSLGEECGRSFHLFLLHKKVVGGRTNPPDTVPVLGKRRAQTKCGSVGPGAAAVLIGCMAVHRLYGLRLLLEPPSTEGATNRGDVCVTRYGGAFLQPMLQGKSKEYYLL
jgi:hypothetical protein